MPNVQYVVAVSPKSEALAGVLPLFVGPIGLLYSAPVAALVLSIIGYPLIFLTLGIGGLILFPFCALWGWLSAAQHNARIKRMTRKTP